MEKGNGVEKKEKSIIILCMQKSEAIIIKTYEDSPRVGGTLLKGTKVL